MNKKLTNAFKIIDKLMLGEIQNFNYRVII